ncbi:MAG TPA: thioesterase family protein [Jatrophihabitans sp.]
MENSYRGDANSQLLLPAWDLPGEVLADQPLTVAVPPLLCAEGGLLFGGWAMALAAEVGRRWSGRHVRSLTCEFLAPIRAGDELSVTVRVLRAGSRVSHCAVTLGCGDRADQAAFTARIVAGDGFVPQARAWSPAPEVPDPDACPGRTFRYRGAGTANDTLDVRLASPEPSPEDDRGGQVLLWARVRCDVDPSAALAVLSDHVPYLIVRSIGGVRYATSVSSTVRLTGSPVDEWVLLEVELAAQDGQFCIGRVRQWGSDGTLLAVADQTAYLRFD